MPVQAFLSVWVQLPPPRVKSQPNVFRGREKVVDVILDAQCEGSLIAQKPVSPASSARPSLHAKNCILSTLRDE